MINKLSTIEKNAKAAIDAASTADEVEHIRVEYLGRKGALPMLLREVKELPASERTKVGSVGNKLRENLETLIEKKRTRLLETSHESILKTEWLDVTHPGRKPPKGHLHPITKVLREITTIFASMGFATVEGPEVETEHYNFDALNIPKDHPARDMWDTFWLKQKNAKDERLLLRTHTSPMQIRYMEQHNPPIRIIVPGRVYRYEASNASHNYQFYQLEGLMVDRNITIANFKAVIQELFSRFFKKSVTIRLRPSAYFPFTEPSFEVDISCITCNAKGCAVCQKSGWVELAGAGMVHPNVYKAAGYNPKDWQGFAFGFGFDRLVMMKYKIPDIRLLNSGDMRFLKQF